MGWERRTKDGFVTPGPVNLTEIVLLASSAGGDASLYDGRDSGSGDLIGTFKGAANVSLPIPFDPPIHCANGIYLDVGTSITEVLILWEPA